MEHIEKLLGLVKDMQDMIHPDDELSKTIDKIGARTGASFRTDELTEDELEFVAAAKHEPTINPGKKDDN